MKNADKFSKSSVDFVQRLAKYSNYPLPSTVLFADILKASFGNNWMFSAFNWVLFYHTEKYFMMFFTLNEFIQKVNMYILYKN